MGFQSSYKDGRYADELSISKLRDTMSPRHLTVAYRCLPCRTSTIECVMTLYHQRKMIVLLLPEGLPPQKTAASATRRFLVFSAVWQKILSSRPHKVKTHRNNYLNATR